MKSIAHKEHHYYSFKNVVACKWYGQKSMHCSCSLPKWLTQSPALVLVSTCWQLLPIRFSYLENLTLIFCGEDNQAGIKCHVGKLPCGPWAATSNVRAPCQQQSNPLQPVSCVASWSRLLRGKCGLRGKPLHCSQRNISLPSSRGLLCLCALLVSAITNVRSGGLDFVLDFCSRTLSPIFTVFTYFARCSSHGLQSGDCILHLICTVQLY